MGRNSLSQPSLKTDARECHGQSAVTWNSQGPSAPVAASTSPEYVGQISPQSGVSKRTCHFRPWSRARHLPWTLPFDRSQALPISIAAAASRTASVGRGVSGDVAQADSRISAGNARRILGFWPNLPDLRLHRRVAACQLQLIRMRLARVCFGSKLAVGLHAENCRLIGARHRFGA